MEEEVTFALNKVNVFCVLKSITLFYNRHHKKWLSKSELMDSEELEGSFAEQLLNLSLIHI